MFENRDEEVTPCNRYSPPEWDPHIIVEVSFTLAETCSTQVIFSGTGYSIAYTNIHTHIHIQALPHTWVWFWTLCMFVFDKLQTPSKRQLERQQRQTTHGRFRCSPVCIIVLDMKVHRGIKHKDGSSHRHLHTKTEYYTQKHSQTRMQTKTWS